MIHGPNIPGSYAILLFTALDLASITPEVRGGGREELSHLQGVAAVGVQEGGEELLHIQGQEGGREEIPLLRGKEQQPSFTGAAVKSIPRPR